MLTATRIGCVAFAVLLAPAVVLAAPPVVTVQDVQTPESPAFVLLGVSPSSVERPSTPSALSVNLLSTFATSDNALPTHYALELAPYWLAAHRTLSRAAYEHPGVGQSMLQTFSISVATSKPPKKIAPDAVDVGFGLRVSLLAGHASSRIDALADRLSSLQLQYLILDALTDALPRAASTPSPLPEPFQAFFDQLSANPNLVQVAGLTPAQQRTAIAAVTRDLTNAMGAPDSDGVRTAIENLQASVDDRMQRAAHSISSEELRRRGWMLTLAGAAASRVPDSTETGLAASRLLRWGVWATPAYRLDQPDIDFIVVARLTQDEEERVRLLDVGGRMAQQVGAFAWSAEYVERLAPLTGPRQPMTERAAATLEYRVATNLVLTAAFGKDFARPALGQSNGGLLSQLGLRIGFGTKPTVALAK